MATTTDNPISFSYTGKNGYKSTVTYSYIPNSSSRIQLSIDPSVASVATPTTKLTLTPTNIPDGQLTVAYNQTITATGGTGPYTFAVNSSNLVTSVNGTNVYFVNIVTAPNTAGTVNYKSGYAPKQAGGFFAGDPVLLVATPNTGHTFKGWTIINADGTPFTSDTPTFEQNGLQIDFYMPPNGVTVIANFDNSNVSSQYLLPPGITLSQSGHLAGTPTVVGTYTFTVEATDSLGNTGSITYTFSVKAAAPTPWTPPSTPGDVPSPTADNKVPKYIRGISYIAPGTNNFHDLGAEFINSTNSYIIANVKEYNNNVIPKGTTIGLYDSNNNQLAYGYSLGTGTEKSMTLYYKCPSNTTVVTCLVQTDNNGTGWIPTVTLSATGTARILQGSSRAIVFGPNAGNYPIGNGMALYAGGYSTGTYIRDVSLFETTELTNGTMVPIGAANNNFIYRLANQGFQNPDYGVLLPANSTNVDPTEVGFAEISTSTLNTPYGYNSKDLIISFDVASSLIQDITPLKLYTPYTFALTNQPVWVQTVPPYLNAPTGYAAFSINWGDRIVNNYPNPIPTDAFYFTHSYTNASDTPYTVTVSAYNNTNINSNNFVASYSLSARFYIQDTFPEISLEDYSKSLNNNLTLPYSKEQVEIGSNEWVVADNINAALGKLESNYNYLRTIASTIRKTPFPEYIEWLYDLIGYPTWNTFISGSDTYYGAYPIWGTYNYGITPGSIVEFKSFKTPFTAPNYYNYIIYTSLSAHSILEVRKNDFYNTKVSVLSSIIPGSINFKAYSVDVSGTNLYLLASETNPQNVDSINPVSVYRYNVNYGDGSLTLVNQIGGLASQNPDDEYAFGSGATIADIPTAIKTFNNKVYVGDKKNNRIKVYNSALTYITEITDQSLSAYNVSPFDIDANTGNVYMVGKIKAPNAPAITSVVTAPISSGETQYKVTWNHDGYRLASVYRDATANFAVYGKPESSSNYVLIGTALNPVISQEIPALTTSVYDSIYNWKQTPNPPRLTQYVFHSGTNYTSFSVVALGADGNSQPSSSTVVPNADSFPSPFTVFVFDNNGSLTNRFTTPQIPSTASILKILVDPTGTFYYIITSDFIYKYTVTGLFINRFNGPSSSPLLLNEDIVNAFIDDRFYLYIATKSRLFKFIDIPTTADLINTDTVNSYYTPLSSYKIQENELIQDWVYNKAIGQMIFNHEVLAKNINGKYTETVDYTNNLVNFGQAVFGKVSGYNDQLINSLGTTDSNFVYSNEIVSSAVINRVLASIYNIQTTILSAIKPEVTVTLPNSQINKLGLVTAATPYVVNQYFQPLPVITTQPSSQNIIAGEPVTIYAAVSSAAGQDALSYQWLFENTAIVGASATDYTFIPELSSIGYYTLSATDNVGSVVSNPAYLGVSLGTLFAFASAQFIGNLYSNYFPTTITDPLLESTEWLTTRYGNDYTANLSIINATEQSVLMLTLKETYGATPWSFNNLVTITISQNSVPLSVLQTSVSANIAIPLSAYLVTDSSSVGADGYPGTFAGTIDVSLSLGTTTSTAYSHPSIVASVQHGGYLYNANFTNNLYSSETYRTTQMSLLSTYGTMPYATVANNTIGGWLDIGIDPYIRHAWSLSGVQTTENPIVNFTPQFPTDVITLSASRLTDPGETEVVLSMGRTLYPKPATPYYTISTSTGSVSKGTGYVTGGGVFKAGTVRVMHGVGINTVANYGPGQSHDSPIIVSGAGIFDPGRYTAAGESPLNTVGEGTVQGSTSSGAKFNIYVDGDKNVQVYFHG